MMKIRINNKTIGENSPVFIIAEAGINHNGSLKNAKKMIDLAKKSKSDAIKFQTFKAEDLATTSSPYFKLFKKVELSDEDFGELADYSKKREIIFLSTPFSEHAVDVLHKIRVPMFKISSGDITHMPLLKYAASKMKPIIISSGMSTLTEINEAVKQIRSQKNDKIMILHSISGYPTPPKDVNMLNIKQLQKQFKNPIGFSDNGIDDLVPLVAVSLGAKIIEKHFTINKKMNVPDKNISCDPNELKTLVEKIRRIEVILGSNEKKVVNSEKETRKNARRSIIAKCNIKKDTKITSNMITIKRPGIGIPPVKINEVIGSFAKQNIKLDEPLLWKKIKSK
jgi:N,N'-diacetyllegionaminate synthase